MRKLKNMLALMLTFTLVLSSFSVSMAKDSLTDVEMAQSLGLLKGDNNGVTDEYLAKPTTRLQAAIMLLRLKGLEEEAKVYSGNENFEDATKVNWLQGQAILSYLKAHPELGWVGNNNKFNPNGVISSKEYYKVMLQLLGYEQKVDYEWLNILTFAEDKGLEKVADVNEFTNKEIAIATIEALKANNKDGVKLIEDLIESELIDAKVAEEIGLYEAPVVEPEVPEEPTVVAKMVSAVSIDSTTLKVDFDSLENIKEEDFNIVAENSTEYDVTHIELLTDEKAAILTVDELKIGEIYTISYNGNSFDIVPIIKEDSTKPVIQSANSVTGDLVRVVFNTKNIRTDSLETTNFTINNDAVITDVTLDVDEMKKDGNFNKTILLLGISGMKSGVAYTLKSENITSYNNVEAPFNTSSFIFAGKDKDNTAPKLKSAASVHGYQVRIIFDEARILDESTLLDASNYSIQPELEITNIKIEKNILGDNKTVLLSTSNQKTRTVYKVKVSNISDGINIMGTEEAVFAGVEAPKYQVPEQAKSHNATTVQIDFKYEANDTALDVSNYTIDHDIEVVDANFAHDSNDKIDKTKVILTTTTMKSSTAYRITIGTGVQNILGQGLKDSKYLVFAGQDPDEDFTEVISARADDTFTVKVLFGESIDTDTAQDIRNYKISELGYPAKAVLSENGKTVTLVVPKQKSGIAYTITLNNLLDKFGNKIESNTKVIFAGKDK